MAVFLRVAHLLREKRNWQKNERDVAALNQIEKAVHVCECGVAMVDEEVRQQARPEEPNEEGHVESGPEGGELLEWNLPESGRSTIQP